MFEACTFQGIGSATLPFTPDPCTTRNKYTLAPFPLPIPFPIAYLSTFSTFPAYDEGGDFRCGDSFTHLGMGADPLSLAHV